MAYLNSKMVFNLLKIKIIVGFIFLIFSCDSSKEELYQIEEFHQKHIAQKTEKLDKIEKPTKVYLDFSPSVLILFGSARKHITPSNLKTFLPSNIQLLRFGNYYPIPFNERLEAKILDSISQQMDTVSLVKETVEKIVQENKNAVLITDFEYFPRDKQIYRAMNQSGKSTFTRLNPYPWATPFFRKWFENGNSLKVVSFPNFVNVNHQPKNLYGLFFLTPDSEIDLSESLLKNKNLIGDKFVLYHFSNLTDLETETQHFNQSSGLLHPDIISAEFVENKTDKIEYYSLKYSDLKEFLSPEQKGVFLQNLIPKFDTALYKNAEFVVETVDFTETFTYFQNFTEHEPIRYGIDPNTGDSTIVKAPSISFRFTGGITDNQVFKLVYNRTKNTLGLKFSPHFKWNENTENGKLYLVKIRLKNIDFSPSENLKNNLQILHTKGFKNESLYKSLMESFPKPVPNQDAILYQCYLRFY